MNVFVDYHHQALYYSLHLLFEKRLGWNLFRPVGWDWYTNGFWNYPSPNVRETAGQMLEMKIIDNSDVDKYYNSASNNIKVGEEQNYLKFKDLKHDVEHKGLTFEQFKNTPIDIIIASVPAHETVYERLRNEYKPNAKLIFHEGNSHKTHAGTVAKNIMISVPKMNYTTPPGSNVIYYHQEFDLDVFNFKPIFRFNRIINLMNCLRQWIDYPTWLQYENLLTDYEWRMHGQEGDEGCIDTAYGIAESLANTTFVFHCKHSAVIGGHILFNTLACGRPIITKGSYIGGELIGELIDGYNIIDLEKRTPEENAEFIRYCSNEDIAKNMSNNAYNTFKKLIDFDKEEKEIRSFLERLQ